MVSLGTIGNGTAVVAMGVSADGATAAGFFNRDVGGGVFRWTSFSGLQALGDLPPEEPYSEVRAISADGNVIVGFSLDGDGHVQATRWATNAPQPLGFLPGSTQSEAFGVSADGSVVVGVSGDEAAIWTEEDWMRPLATVLAEVYRIDVGRATAATARSTPPSTAPASESTCRTAPTPAMRTTCSR